MNVSRAVPREGKKKKYIEEIFVKINRTCLLKRRRRRYGAFARKQSTK